MLGEGYPAELLEDTAHVTDWSFVKDGDLAQIRQPLSNLGVNYYYSDTVRHKPGGHLDAFPGSHDVEALPPAGKLTHMGWPQDPAALTEELVGLSRRFPGLPLVVTENGSAWEDKVADAAVHDPERVAYLEAHLEALGRAMDQGAPVTGYFAWSLMDNFEWAWGYTRRFGLFYTDYTTQDRLWKDSGRLFSQVAQTGQLVKE
jgi:beta-glucosidase